MDCAVLLVVLVCLGSRLICQVYGSGSQDPVSNEEALVLVVETTKRCYLANDQFVADQTNPLIEEFLFACLAESEDEKELNNMFSKTDKALFIKKTHKNVKTKNGQTDNPISHKCDRMVIPSIISIGHDANNLEVELYLVGYEIFLGDELASIKFDFYDSAGVDKRFAWFNVYTVAFNHQTQNVASVFSHSLAYKDYKISPPQETNVSNYFLGKYVFHENLRVANIYSNKNYQDFVFNEKRFKEMVLPISYVDFEQKRYLIEIHLAALDSFGAPALRRTVQNYGNIAFMWNMVYNKVWWKIETYVELLAQGVNGINVITGIHGTLRLSGVDMYYGPNNTLKIPAAYFKIISYSPNINEKYNMVIVTSNNPYDKSDRTIDNICKQNQCKQFGWEYIQQDSPGMGRTTCCELTTQVLTELKMKRYESLVDKALDLNKVPHWSTDRLTLDLKSYTVNQLSGKEVGKPADDDIYKSDETLKVPNDDEKITFSRFISILYSNYVQPYFSKEGVRIEKVVERPSG